ncbi:basic proline-rich protein-like isoform X1 [Pipra filicauda]|uniref:Basic proline-rich protein-like isoform X1 n=1 Tax=Pipra filicauda TaxID=649802 RepID=A0A7R5KDG6_9PASS|nr:basic proline-rich protein-like isoform X1 [Pipra filicauda]XP_039234393.1 basic proline-rich protein-like isoform X1 [Pipra filicauda]XP_039234394.1 basic proline-rich protein-like isoform X1 [Pipra filicauda]
MVFTSGMGAKGAVAVTRAGRCCGGAQQRPSLPPRGRRGAVGPAEGREPGLCWAGGVLLCVPCRAVPCDRSEFVTPPSPPGSASPLPLPAPALPRPLHPPRGGAGGGEGLPGYLGRPSPAPLGPGLAPGAVQGGARPLGQRREGTAPAFVRPAWKASREPVARGNGLAVAVPCAGGAGIPRVPWFSLKVQSKAGSQSREALTNATARLYRVLISFSEVSVID